MFSGLPFLSTNIYAKITGSLNSEEKKAVTNALDNAYKDATTEYFAKYADLKEIEIISPSAKLSDIKFKKILAKKASENLEVLNISSLSKKELLKEITFIIYTEREFSTASKYDKYIIRNIAAENKKISEEANTLVGAVLNNVEARKKELKNTQKDLTDIKKEKQNLMAEVRINENLYLERTKEADAKENIIKGMTKADPADEQYFAKEKYQATLREELFVAKDKQRDAQQRTEYYQSFIKYLSARENYLKEKVNLMKGGDESTVEKMQAAAEEVYFSALSLEHIAANILKTNKSILKETMKPTENEVAHDLDIYAIQKNRANERLAKVKIWSIWTKTVEALKDNTNAEFNFLEILTGYNKGIHNIDNLKVAAESLKTVNADSRKVILRGIL